MAKESKRNINIPSKIIDMLKFYKKECNMKKLSLGSAWFDSGYIFTQENGKPMHPDTLTDYCTKFRNKYNKQIEQDNANRDKTNKIPLLPHINPHAFRHSQASMLILSGLDCATVSKRLGHAKVSTTTDIYSHLIQKADVEASDTLADMFLRKEKIS